MHNRWDFTESPRQQVKSWEISGSTNICQCVSVSERSRNKAKWLDYSRYWLGEIQFFFLWYEVMYFMSFFKQTIRLWCDLLKLTENEVFYYWLYKRPFCGCGFPVYRVQPHLGNTQLSGEKTSQTPCLSATQHAAIKNTWGHHPLFCLRMVKSALS